MEEANMEGREKKKERMEKKKHELAVIARWDIWKRAKKRERRRAVENICHLYYSTSETSARFIHAKTFSINQRNDMLQFTWYETK